MVEKLIETGAVCRPAHLSTEGTYEYLRTGTDGGCPSESHLEDSKALPYYANHQSVIKVLLES